MPDDLEIPEVWSAELLMGGLGENGTASTNGKDAPPSPRRRKSKLDVVKVDPALWGRPGFLTEDECHIFVSHSCFGSEVGTNNHEMGLSLILVSLVY